MIFEEVLQRFEARRVGSGYMAKCPAHEDRTASLSIAEENGKILLNCHAGCATKDVLGARGLTFNDLYQGPVITAEYDYRDEAGELLFQVLRYSPKSFKQRRPDGQGGWVSNVNGVRRVPYNLVEFLPAKDVLVVEGEKDVETARKFGLVATCNSGGAGKWRVVYVSEQSRPSLALQMREIGFTGGEPIETLRLITREDWSRFTYPDFLVRLEKEILQSGTYNFLAIDTFHTVARLEDETNASEVNRVGNLTLDVAARNNMGLEINRHDRKSGGDVGVSGRSSIQLSGLVDTILHLVRVPGQDTQRKLEAVSRVAIPHTQLVDLVNGVYVNLGEVTPTENRQAQVDAWYAEDTNLTAPAVVALFAALTPPIEVGESTARRYLAQAKRSGGEQ